MEDFKKKIIKNRKVYENSPEVLRYIEHNSDCIICLKKVEESILKENPKEMTKKDQKDENTIQSTEKVPIANYSSNFYLWAKRLGIIENFNFMHQQIVSSNPLASDAIVMSYIEFINSIDLSPSKESIKIFNLKAFSKISNMSNKDPIVYKFICKLSSDPFMYSKTDKVSGLFVEIFMFLYSKRVGYDSKLLKKRIIEHAFLFKPDCSYDIDLCNDPYIDKYVVQLRFNSRDLDEAIFLNKVYLSISVDKEFFILFHKRIVETLSSLDCKYIISFLKYTFTYKTVLFTCISEEQLIKLIISFYKANGKTDVIISIIMILWEKLYDDGLSRLLLAELEALCSMSKKYQKYLKLFEIRSIGYLEDFYELIERNCDSFDYLNYILDDCKGIISVAKSQIVLLSVLGIIIAICKNGKSEFLEKLINPCLELITKIFSVIKPDKDVYDFNQAQWNNLSDILLIGVRIEAGIDLEKKKKCGQRKESMLTKLCMKLADQMLKVEDILIKLSFNDIIRLKRKGFVFNDIAE